MNSIATWIAVVLLALANASCASAGLHHWAEDRVPRSEVLGFVDRGGDGDALLVRLHGERGYADGVYWVAVTTATDGVHRAPPAPPLRLDAEREARAIEIAGKSSNVARLWRIGGNAQVDWVLIDGLEGARAEPVGSSSEAFDGELHEIRIPDRRYYLSLEGQVKIEGVPGRFTRVDIHLRRTLQERYEPRGAAYLPPARRVTERRPLAVLAAPFVFAADVVLFPIELFLLLFVTGTLETGQLRGGVGASF